MERLMPIDPPGHLFVFGLGYSALVLAKRLASKGWCITGTSRTDEGFSEIEHHGYRAIRFDGFGPPPEGALDGATHVLASVPPEEGGDPVLLCCGEELGRRAAQFGWVGYLSTTGVYGDRGGDWVDETSELTPAGVRGRRRMEAEAAWLELHHAHGLPVHIFRLAGIYGTGRNQLESVLDGSARRIVKPGQIFSRIHVDDIAGIIEASIAQPRPGAAYNLADDEPCPPEDVVVYAAQLLGRPSPPKIAFEDAELTPMARSFYSESKRVSNRLIKEELGYTLRFPTYREGLKALLPTVLVRS